MTFREQVYEVVKEIPSGKVATYGQVAAMVGKVRAARMVGFALRALGLNENQIPWWRVVNREGYLSINHGDGGVEKAVQRDLLLDEGVEVDERLCIDLSKYLWRNL